MIRILQRRQIDDNKWNQVISEARHECIYPYSWYMDLCADNWCALVKDDYTWVMPVAFRYRIRVKYFYQPIYCQQYGIYSSREITPEITREFLRALHLHFKLGDYAFNAGNIVGEQDGYYVADNSNYILHLDKTYDYLYSNFTENCWRNCRKAYKSGLEFTDTVSVEEVIKLKMAGNPKGLGPDFAGFALRLFTTLQEKKRVKVYGSTLRGELVAAAVFVFSEKRIHYLLSASSDAGKDMRAMFMVVDRVIREYAGSGRILDFEGSNITSIARFFRGFGAKPEIYQRVSFQNFASKLIKRLRNV